MTLALFSQVRVRAWFSPPCLLDEDDLRRSFDHLLPRHRSFFPQPRVASVPWQPVALRYVGAEKREAVVAMARDGGLESCGCGSPPGAGARLWPSGGGSGC